MKIRNWLKIKITCFTYHPIGRIKNGFPIKLSPYQLQHVIYDHSRVQNDRLKRQLSFDLREHIWIVQLCHTTIAYFVKTLLIIKTLFTKTSSKGLTRVGNI